MESCSHVFLLDDRVRKVELAPHPGKRNTLDVEASIIADLNALNCPCVPKLLDRGRNVNGQPFMDLERIRPVGQPPIEDVWLSYLATRGLGWVHGDPQPRNVLFDGEIAWLIDFDQAHHPSGTAEEDLAGSFCDTDWRPILSSMARTRLDLGKTALARLGVSTNGFGGIYHKLDECSVFIDGERSMDARRPVLDRIDFTNELVLDVGCNTGALTRFIAKRGAKQVDGIEICRTHALLGQMINCITGARNALITHADMSRHRLAKDYDTILLCSVLQHIEDLSHLALECRRAKRLIIEAKPKERGGKYNPATGWVSTQTFDYSNLKELISFLEWLFYGRFVFKRDYGQGDRDRHFLEFIRK